MRAFTRALDRTLAQLTVPQGFTLSIGGSFAVAAHAYGMPSGTRAAEFVAGALLAFVILVAIAARPPLEPGPVLPLMGIARYNVTPIFVIGLVALAVRILSSSTLGFPVAGGIAAGGYAISISLIDLYTRRRMGI